MKLLALLKAKALVTIVGGVLVLGGATAAFAATPSGQHVVQSLTHASASATVEAKATHDAKKTDQKDSGKADSKSCVGQSDAQNLAGKYKLSTAITGTAVKDICDLHKNTFKSANASGVSVASNRNYGYGEIDQLLTYAQYLASHDTAKAGGKLNDSNVSTYLASALAKCGSTSLEKCLMTNIPNYTPGKNNSNPTTHGNKPTATPTPADHGNKPTATPTPKH